MYRQESHSLVNLKTCHAQDIYEGCDSRTSSFRILIFSLDGRMVFFFGIANQGVKKDQRPQSSAASKSCCRTWPKWNNLTYLRHEDPIDPIALNLIRSTRLPWLLGPFFSTIFSLVFVRAFEPASSMTSMACARARSSSRFVDVSRRLHRIGTIWEKIEQLKVRNALHVFVVLRIASQCFSPLPPYVLSQLLYFGILSNIGKQIQIQFSQNCTFPKH